MAIQIGEVTVATANRKIYVIGGSTADVVDQKLNQEYDVAKDSWRNRAPLPRGMTHAAATALNGKIYVVGAFTASGHGNAVNLVYEYDPATDAWRTLAPIKESARLGRRHRFEWKNSRDRRARRRQSYCDDARSFRSRQRQMDRARAAAQGARSFGCGRRWRRIHAIGGRLDASSQNTDFNDIYNPTTNTWQAGPPLPTARSGIAGVLYQDKIFVAGGECRDKKTYPEFEAYDLKTNRWSAFAPMPAGRHGFGGVVVGNSIYYAGGAWNAVAAEGRMSCWCLVWGRGRSPFCHSALF